MKLDIGKSGKYLISVYRRRDLVILTSCVVPLHHPNSKSSLISISINLPQSLINWLSLLHLGMGSCLWSDGRVVVAMVVLVSNSCPICNGGPTTWGQWKHVLVPRPIVMVALTQNIIGSLPSWHSLDSSYLPRTRHAICPVRSILRGLDHWWKLQFLVVGIIALFSGIPFSSSNYFFIQLNYLVYWSSRLSLIMPCWNGIGVWLMRVMNALACIILLIVWSHCGSDWWIIALHKINWINTIANYVSRVAYSSVSVSHVELMEMVWSMHDRVSCSIVTAAALSCVRLHRVKVMMVASMMAISPSSSVPVELIVRAWKAS